MKITIVSSWFTLILVSLPSFTLAAALEKTTVSFSGYIKADPLWSTYSDGELSSGNLGRDFYIPSLTPVGGVDESAQFDAHIRQSRFRFTSDTLLDNQEKISGLLEFDFQTTPGGDERISNSYSPRVRHAFMKYKKWLVGQTWSTFQDVKTLPETLDFIGATDGTIFVRQVQLRYTNGAFEFAIENPETTVTPFGGGARIITDDNILPDFIARYTLSDQWGHIAFAGLVRQLSYEQRQGGSDIDSEVSAYGISVTSKILLGRNDLRIMANYGSGLGRYLGLNIVNGAVLDEDNELEAIDSYGLAIAYHHQWDSRWRSNVTYSLFAADNDVNLVGSGASKDTYSARANILFSPVAAITVGAELTFAERTLENTDDGNMTRLQLSASYNF